MNKRQTAKVRESIRICNMKLNTILPHLSDDKRILNESFNRLLIEKAILRDKLKHTEPSFLAKIIKKIKNPKKEFICDYF